MGGAELQARKAIQRPLKNEMGERNGGFEWIANDVGEQAVALQPFLGGCDALGMEENQCTELLRLGPKGVQFCYRQLLDVVAPPDRSTAQPQLIDTFFRPLA